MLKKILLVAVLLFSAQIWAQERVLLTGTKIGTSFSTFSGWRETKLLTSPTIGVFVNIPVSEKFSLLTGVDVCTIGYNEKNVSSDGVISYSPQPIGAIAIPLITKYYLAKGFHVQGGGELSILMDLVGEDGQYHKYNSGLIAGVGYDFSMIQIYFRYIHGITNISKSLNYWGGTPEEPEFFDFTEKNRVFQVGLEFRLYKKKEKVKNQKFGKYKKPQ